MHHLTRNKQQKGFTLIEAVVATAVFAFVVSSVIGVYLSTFRLDRKTRAQRAVTQNARFILEYLAKEVRNGTINYPSYPSGIVPSNPDLYVENQANELEKFFLNNQNMQLTKNGSTTNLNSSGVKVTNLKFYISPTGDPYTVAKTYNQQPRVTVVMELTSNYGTKAGETVKLNFQDTFTVRVYPSRQ